MFRPTRTAPPGSFQMTRVHILSPFMDQMWDESVLRQWVSECSPGYGARGPPLDRGACGLSAISVGNPSSLSTVETDGKQRELHRRSSRAICFSPPCTGASLSFSTYVADQRVPRIAESDKACERSACGQLLFVCITGLVFAWALGSRARGEIGGEFCDFARDVTRDVFGEQPPAACSK